MAEINTDDVRAPVSWQTPRGADCADRPRTTPLTCSVVAAAVTAVLLLAGCDSRPPAISPTAAAERLPSAPQARATVTDLADEVATVITTGTDLVESPDGAWERSWDCSGAPTAGHTAVQYAADRQWFSESGQATSELVQPLVDHFTEQGWQVAEDRTGSSGYRYVRIDHGQYTVEVSGERAARSGRATQLGLTVYSPCLPGRDAR